MTEAEQAVLALVCGYPDWERRGLAMLVSHVDESGKGDPQILVVGCVTALPGQWIKFTKDWLAALPDGVNYFHYTDDCQKPWFEETIPKLLDVINNNAMRADLLAIRVPVYRSLFSGKVGKTYDDPCHQGYVAIITQNLLELSMCRSAIGKVDFIFDDLGDTELLELRGAWRRLRKNSPNKAIKKLVGSEPTCRSDEVVVPLQGADLIAGLMWRACLGKGSAPTHVEGLKITHRATLWDENTLPPLFNGMDRTQLEFGISYEDGKRRSKRLKPARKLLRAKRRS